MCHIEYMYLLHGASARTPCKEVLLGAHSSAVDDVQLVSIPF